MQVSIVTRTRPNKSWCLCFLFCKILGLIPDSLTLRTIRGIKPDNGCRRALKERRGLQMPHGVWHGRKKSWGCILQTSVLYMNHLEIKDYV